MFTGIIEELGTVRRLDRAGQSAQLVISCKKVLEGCRPGDSIAVNGACLTVTRFDAASFTAEASSETLVRTTLGASKSGDTVNLERALRFGDRL
ncbi:MAG: riboflavin synthase, partial [Nitrospirota bacterium]|nr:riboflavin synthase [Nitrospirota bacterium]